MAYTRQELIAGYCELKGCTVADLPRLEQEIQARLDLKRIRLQKELDSVPLSAREQMKLSAINYLYNKNRETVIAENSNVTL